MKFNKTVAVKELIFHIILIAFSFIVLIPVIYVVSSGFRTNQVMYGSVIDYNSWIDTRIADSTDSKISKKIYIKKSSRFYPIFLRKIKNIRQST